MHDSISTAFAGRSDLLHRDQGVPRIEEGIISAGVEDAYE